jgi:hypothetical protein
VVAGWLAGWQAGSAFWGPENSTPIDTFTAPHFSSVTNSPDSESLA